MCPPVCPHRAHQVNLEHALALIRGVKRRIVENPLGCTCSKSRRNADLRYQSLRLCDSSISRFWFSFFPRKAMTMPESNRSSAHVTKTLFAGRYVIHPSTAPDTRPHRAARVDAECAYRSGPCRRWTWQTCDCQCRRFVEYDWGDPEEFC